MDVLGEIVSEDENRGFIKSGETYIPNLGLNDEGTNYIATGTLNVDLTNKTGDYCIRLNITSNVGNALSIKTSTNSTVASISTNQTVTERNYYYQKLHGGNIYTFIFSTSSATDECVTTINSIDVFEVEDELCRFDLVDGKYKSNNVGYYTSSTGEIEIDLRQRTGEYKILLNDIYSVGRGSSRIRITATDYDESVSTQANQSVNVEKIVKGGKLYTIKYEYYRTSTSGEIYLSFAPPQVEAVLINQTETTDESGLININAKPGKYRIKETKPPTG